MPSWRPFGAQRTLEVRLHCEEERMNHQDTKTPSRAEVKQVVHHLEAPFRVGCVLFGVSGYGDYGQDSRSF